MIAFNYPGRTGSCGTVTTNGKTYAASANTVTSTPTTEEIRLACLVMRLAGENAALRLKENFRSITCNKCGWRTALFMKPQPSFVMCDCLVQALRDRLADVTMPRAIGDADRLLGMPVYIWGRIPDAVMRANMPELFSEAWKER